MQIRFNGAVIGQEPQDGGTDIITGFCPEDEHDVEIAKPLRAAWASLFPRGNQVETLSGTIKPRTATTSGAAVVALYLQCKTLPLAGPLIFTEMGAGVSYASAARRRLRIAYRNGVAYAIELTFVAVNPTDALVLATESGLPLATEGGVVIAPDLATPAPALGTESGIPITTESGSIITPDS